MITGPGYTIIYMTIRVRMGATNLSAITVEAVMWVIAVGPMALAT
jgi:hypothetical protein